MKYLQKFNSTIDRDLSLYNDTYDVVTFCGRNERIPDDEIWYTYNESEGYLPIDVDVLNKILPDDVDNAWEWEDVFGYPKPTNTYSNGKGILKFEGPLRKMGYDGHLENIFHDLEIDTITFPRKITKIQTDNLFSNCALKKVTFTSPIINSIYYLEDDKYPSGFFHSCNDLESVELPAGFTSLRLDDTGDWNDTNKIKKFKVPYTVEKLYNGCFTGCHELEEIELPDGLLEIGYNVFEGCLIKELNIPITVTYIDSSSISYCNNLESITLSGNLADGNEIVTTCDNLNSLFLSKTVNNYTYMTVVGCPKISTISVSPDNPIYDSRDNCNAVIETATNTLISGCKNTVIPNTVEIIGSYALSMYDLGGRLIFNTLNIPDSVETIGVGAFCDIQCESIIIGTGIKNIGNTAFYGIYNLEQITCKAATPPVLGNNTLTNIGSPTIYVPSGSVNAYKAASGWSAYANNIQAIPS